MTTTELITGIAVAWLLADFLSGLFHWWEDRYGNPDWPVLGRYVVQPNIEHHEFPKRMLEGSYLTRNSTTIIPAAFGAVVAWLVGGPWWLVLSFAFLSQGNQVHAWTHGPAPALVRMLQEMGLMISPQQHAKHHRQPFDTNFCTMSPALNPILSAVRFWPAMEATLAFVGIRTFSARADQQRAVA